MEITDELIACYVEGTVTEEERDAVRAYLCEHPCELERILNLMDNDIEDYLGEREETAVREDMDDDALTDIALSAAAFAPPHRLPIVPDREELLKRREGVIKRLQRMCDELNEL